MEIIVQQEHYQRGTALLSVHPQFHYINVLPGTCLPYASLLPPLLISSPARASWGFCLIRHGWGLCLSPSDERSAVERQTAGETKGFFLLRSHIGAISQTAVPLEGVPQLSLWLALSLFIPSCFSTDLWKYQKVGWRGPTKVEPTLWRVGTAYYNQRPPPLPPPPPPPSRPKPCLSHLQLFWSITQFI